MSGMLLIARRELGAYFNSIWGYVVVSVILAINGLFFNAFAVTDKPKLSSEVLESFFEYTWGLTVIAAILLTMRLIAEERQTGTLTLLDSSPLSDAQVVGGKFLSAFLFLSVFTLLSLYMPALIFVNGKVSLGHIAAGYAGILLTAGSTLAMGTFASSVTRSQVVAAIIGGVLLAFFILCWLVARIADPPVDGIFAYMAYFDAHFHTTFRRGQIHLKDVVYYLSLTWVFLLLATRVLSARRWR